MLNPEVSYVRYLIGWIAKTFDYINRVNLMLPLSVYEGAWTHSSPLIAMHLLDRSCVIIGIFFEIPRTQTSTSPSVLVSHVLQNGLLATLWNRLTNVASIEFASVLSLLQDVSANGATNEKFPHSWLLILLEVCLLTDLVLPRGRSQRRAHLELPCTYQGQDF